MKKTFSLVTSGILIATVALVASFGFEIQRDTAPVAEAATRKVTICHRTRAVTNPYRRITVSPNSITKSRGHGGHLGGVFNTTANYYDTNPKNWGDIIPSGDSDGTPYNGANNIDANWDAAGKAIFLPTGANASKCNRMTAKQFYDYQLAAGVPQADIITELNEMEANEDKALLAELGGTFSTSNLSTWATAIAVTTNAATSVTDGTGSNGSAILNGSLKFKSGSTVRWFFELSSSPAFTSVRNTGETKLYGTANSLSANGTTQNVTGVSVTGLTAGTYYFRIVGISDYDTDTEGILYGETKSFGIAVPVITTETLADGVVGTPYSETINATGGTGAKTNFRLNTGSLPGGLSITNPGTPDSTAALAGTPTTRGLYTLPFIVSDSATPTANTSAVKELTLRIREAQTITIPDPGSKSYGDASFSAGITSNVTADDIGDLGSFTSYSSSTPDVCTISNSGQVTLTGAGSCTISATHSGNGYWLTKTESRTFTVGTKAITIKAANKSKVVSGTEPTPSYTITVGSLVGSDAISSVTYDYVGNNHSPTNSIPNVAGTFDIVPSGAAMTGGRETNYTISYANGVLTVSATATAQTIDFPDPADKTYGDDPFVISATSKDGSTNTDLQVEFTSQTTSVCTVGTASIASGVSLVTVTILSKGTCTIQATQPGGSNGTTTYSAATPVSQSIEVAPRPITIKAADKSKIVNGTEPTPSYTITVGSLAASDSISSVTYGYSGNGHTPPTSIPNVVGTFTITPAAAVMTGGRQSNYTINYVTGVLTVSLGSVAQNIDFPDPADKTFGDDPFDISATSKDGNNNTDLEIVFTSLTPSVCTVGTEVLASGVTKVTVTIVGVGTCTIEASQPGGSNGSTTYSAATSVTQSFEILPKPLVITAADKSKTVNGTNPTFTFTATGLVGSDAVGSVTYTFSSASYTASTTVPNVAGSFAIAPSAAVFTTGTASNYAISYVNGTLTVTEAPLVAANAPTAPAVGRVIGEAWFDINKNDKRESNEPLLPGLPVTLEPRAGVTAARASSTVKTFASTLVTDANGAFDFSGLAPGAYTIRGVLPEDRGITKSWDTDGVADWTVNVVVVANEVKRGDLAGIGQAGFTGQVTSGPTGAVTPRAEVTALWSGFDTKFETKDDVRFTIRADANGSYSLAGLPIGEFKVTAVDPATKAVASAQSVTLTKAATVPAKRPEIVLAVVPEKLPATGQESGSPVQLALLMLLAGGLVAVLPRVRRRSQPRT